VIKHSTAENGKFQSLDFVQEAGYDASVVALEEGLYDLGIATRATEMKVLSGGLCLSSDKGTRDSMTDPVTFKKGDRVAFSAEPGTALYVIYF
jgi:uncharacterized protein YaiE (UPF0345 family)